MEGFARGLEFISNISAVAKGFQNLSAKSSGVVAGSARSVDFISNSFYTPDGQVFKVGDIEYLTITADPVAQIPYFSAPFAGPATHIFVTGGTVTEDALEKVVEEYLADDVFTYAFLDKIIISGDVSASLDEVEEKTKSLKSKIVFPCNQGSCGCSSPKLTSKLPHGPLFAIANGTTLSLSKVFRLYDDPYRTFVNGIYEIDGVYKPLGYYDPYWQHAKIPVPSRLYSIGDDRPLAGMRVGVKDIFDVKGALSTWGSKAHSATSGPANFTASSIQRIIDLGGVVVGKQKTSQFASPESCWEWIDFACPENPRGDGMLSCSASSTGAGCSVAAYDWLDYAIGSDTGQSVRQPAAFSGTYGIRPSQGLISLDHAMSIGSAVDTAGVFARDPERFAYFAKHWYTNDLHQDATITGLPPMEVPDEKTYPRHILYPIDVLPLQNPAAEVLLQQFLENLFKTMGITTKKFNLTGRIAEVTGRPHTEVIDDLHVLFTDEQQESVALPLLEHYKPHFPRFEKPFVNLFWDIKLKTEKRARVIERRREDAKKWHEQVLFPTEDSCSESLIIYDIGTGGLPTFRLKDLNDQPGATHVKSPYGYEPMSFVSSYFGSPDITVPIGQVPYFSNVTREENMMPVTVSLLARRGCDKVLLNLIADLGRKGVLKPVLTGRNAYT